MVLISDILFIAGALGAAFYCLVLSRRLSRFTDLEKGVGGAIAVLSAQVDDMTRTLKAAQKAAGGSADELERLTARAEEAARRLELHFAAMHDLEAETAAPQAGPAPAPPPEAFDPWSAAPARAAGPGDRPADRAPQQAPAQPGFGSRRGAAQPGAQDAGSVFTSLRAARREAAE